MSLAATLGRDEEKIEVGGVTYTLSAPTLQAYLDADKQLRQMLGHPLRRAAEYAAQVPAAHAQAYWQAAHKAEAEEADKGDLLQRAPLDVRLATIAYMLLFRHHRDRIQTIDQAAAWLADADLDAFARICATLLPERTSRPTTAPQTGPV
jgi:formiminotetrahydrofolate cyclodeaminase